MQTIGLSPKLYPALAAIAAGVLLTVFVDREIGLTILGTGVTLLAGGYVAPPGEVVPLEPVGPASDALLPDDVKARIDSEAGYTLVEVGLFLVLLAVAAAVVVAFVT